MRKITDSVIDALSKPAIQNGRMPKVKRKDGKPKASLNGPVKTAQPPAGGWRCDACLMSGRGGVALLAHTGKTNHRVFSALDYR